MKLYLLIFILLIGCSNLNIIDRGTQYSRDKARCEIIASDLMQDIKRDTFMEKLGYFFLHSHSNYVEECLQKRGYTFNEDEEY